MIIGICGKSGSGKSTLAREIIQYSHINTVHLDIDKIGHKVLTFKEVFEELRTSFGTYVVDGNAVNRKKLGEIVFNSRREMKKLSNITWNYMQIEIDKFIEQNNNNIIILDWLLLPTTKYFEMCDITILLDIPYEIRKQRAIKRDNITENAFDLREKASINFDEYNFSYIMHENNNNEIRKLVNLI